MAVLETKAVDVGAPDSDFDVTEPDPQTKSLDLSDNTLLVCTARGISIQDTRTDRSRDDAHYLYRVEAGEGPAPRFHATLCVLRAGRLLPDGEVMEVVSLALGYPHRAYGHNTLEGVATYADGAQEDWRIQVNPLQMRFDWVRQPHAHTDPLVFRVVLPRNGGALQLWQTGRGRQLAHLPGAETEPSDDNTLSAEQETEMLFYAPHPKNCCHFEMPTGGDVKVTWGTGAAALLPGDPDWARRMPRDVDESLWELSWQTDLSSIVHFTGSVGISAAIREFDGRKTLDPVNASHDFGDFYFQMYAGCLPLNLLHWAGRTLARAAVLPAGVEEKSPLAPLRDVAWAAEFLYLLDPVAIGELLRDSLEVCLERSAPDAAGWPDGHLTDEECALVLLMAGRHYRITGDSHFVEKHIRHWRRCAEHLLELRRPSEAMPVVRQTWDAQGVTLGKEPYFVALCYAGLSRLAQLEAALPDPVMDDMWDTAALTLRAAATTAYEEGGLWHRDNHVFINYVDLKDPGMASPHEQNWDESALQREGVPRTEFALYETLVPFWLGLVEGTDTIWKAFDWIDDHYTYTSGRGGVSFPPHVVRTFIALLDVCLRQRHGIEGAERLLQLILDRALDGGIPLTESPFGTYAGGTCPALKGPGCRSRSVPAGQLMDNSPFFALIIQIHYGLDYSWRGWQIGHPQPLRSYPLSRLSNLRHHGATFNISWQGRGRVKRITINGTAMNTQLLNHTEGEHEIIVFLS
jgi:hypothetical protein